MLKCHICQEEILKGQRSHTVEFISTENDGQISGTFMAEVCSPCEQEMSRQLTEENDFWFGLQMPEPRSTCIPGWLDDPRILQRMEIEDGAELPLKARKMWA